jgi:hypothetical protein
MALATAAALPTLPSSPSPFAPAGCTVPTLDLRSSSNNLCVSMTANPNREVPGESLLRCVPGGTVCRTSCYFTPNRAAWNSATIDVAASFPNS